MNSMITKTLRETYGPTGAAVKTVMAITGAGERTVKNWFEGKNAPSGANLIKLMKHSDEVFETILILAGRENLLKAKKLIDAKDKLVEILDLILELEQSAEQYNGRKKNIL